MMDPWQECPIPLRRGGSQWQRRHSVKRSLHGSLIQLRIASDGGGLPTITLFLYWNRH